jgi:hypothetical protein
MVFASLILVVTKAGLKNVAAVTDLVIRT